MAATKGLLAKKMGMTRLFSEDGTVTPVTVLDATSNVVLGVKSEDSADGYSAVQIGFGEKSEKNITKAQAGNFKKAGVTPRQQVTEFRLADTSGFESGNDISVADIFSDGDKVDVSGLSKGRGFAGVMKKYNFAGFIRTHGTHEFFRHGGSIGTRLTPGHVLKGKKMPGQMGNQRVTIQNIEVVKVDAERNLLFVKGGVPGPNGTVLEIRQAVK
ncbi:MAG: 50S ribosomal protein L3 [Myxococcota bacterium]|nr:50S ribosomal protein L3 [Myxococcota bacterium]